MADGVIESISKMEQLSLRPTEPAVSAGGSKAKNKKKKDARSSKKGVAETSSGGTKSKIQEGSGGHPSRPPSNPPSKKSICFDYIELSMKHYIDVDYNFAFSVPANRQPLYLQASEIYAERLHLPARMSSIPFDFIYTSDRYVLVSPKSTHADLGFEKQLTACKDHSATLLLQLETQTQAMDHVKGEQADSKFNLAALEARFQLQVVELEDRIKAKDKELQAKVAELEGRNKELEEKIREMQSMVSKLLDNSELQYITRRRIIVEKARQVLLQKLGLAKKPEVLTWERFVESLSLTQKRNSGTTDSMLQEMGIGLYELNKKVYTMDKIVEMAHAVNNIANSMEKEKWQALLVYAYDRRPEEVEFGLV